MSPPGKILDALKKYLQLLEKKKDLGPFIYAVKRLSFANNRINRKPMVMPILWFWPIDL